jgi:osmotically inducible protein OsmC
MPHIDEFGSRRLRHFDHRPTHPAEGETMSISKASARWEGTLKDGRGTMKPANAGDVPFSLGTRFEGQKGSNPEEMIGAALAGCFSMALSAALSKAGHAPETIDTSADVHLEKDGGGFKVAKIALTTRAKVAGVDAATFAATAKETKANCPIGKALAAVPIELDAQLA